MRVQLALTMYGKGWNPQEGLVNLDQLRLEPAVAVRYNDSSGN